MKRFTAIIILFLTAALATCQVNVPVIGSVTIAWNATPNVLPGERYEIYIDKYPATTAPVLVTTTALFEWTFTISIEGAYRFGVRALKLVDGVTVPLEYAWSDIDGTPAPWYVTYYKATGKVQMLRVK